MVGGQEKEEFVKFILTLKILTMKNYKIKTLLKKVILQKSVNCKFEKSVASFFHARCVSGTFSRTEILTCLLCHQPKMLKIFRTCM